MEVALITMKKEFRIELDKNKYPIKDLSKATNEERMKFMFDIVQRILLENMATREIFLKELGISEEKYRSYVKKALKDYEMSKM